MNQMTVLLSFADGQDVFGVPVFPFRCVRFKADIQDARPSTRQNFKPGDWTCQVLNVEVLKVQICLMFVLHLRNTSSHKSPMDV